MSLFLEWDAACNFAIQILATPELALSPNQQLSMAISYRIHDWIGLAFNELIMIPAHAFSLEEFLLLGPPITHIIVSTQSVICNHQLLVSYNPSRPPSHNNSCLKPIMACQQNWESAWLDGLARHYLHPDFPLSPDDMLSKLENASVVGVTNACRLHAVNILKEQ